MCYAVCIKDLMRDLMPVKESYHISKGLIVPEVNYEME
jgi:hypothetical protein